MDDTYNYSRAGKKRSMLNKFNNSLRFYVIAKKLEDMMSERAKGDDASYQLSQFVSVSSSL